ncbi:ATP synthase protein I [Cribrihabitans marinus]|uniref:ATP synthase protein I n=1 Tax=Cribrihabitans marinus TaxID=1227549 RepID=A0A1H7DFW7_9RHOB|nr:AtpZ/AtpI family protein [Cribrihabitans marinus]GGH39021.1 ATP synthase protein I [Cribrihabitans marinus]SEK00596.1 ATP synthase protein I [Cribrihabitans marinus]
MSEDDQKQRLSQLEARIAAAKKTQAPAERADKHYSQGELAWRMVIEMTAGIAIGFGIGYGLDSLFGTIPIFLVLFTLLGFAAGINVMLRSAKEVQAKKMADDAAERDERD